MKLPAALLLSLVATAAGAASADKARPPVQPDSDYCSRRDADPQKCLIQDGPPNPNIIIRKPPPPPPPPAPRTPAKKLPEAK